MTILAFIYPTVPVATEPPALTGLGVILLQRPVRKKTDRNTVCRADCLVCWQTETDFQQISLRGRVWGILSVFWVRFVQDRLAGHRFLI